MTDLARLRPLLPHLEALAEASGLDKQQALRPIERRLARAVRALWKAQRTELLAALDQHAHLFETVRARLVEAGPIPPAELDRIWQAVAAATGGPLAETLDDLAGTAMHRGHRAAAADVGLTISFDLAHPRAIAYLANFGGRLVTGLNRTSHAELRTLLANSAGKSYSQVTTEIRRKFDGWTRSRAELVAVTESADAYGHGAAMARQQIMDEGLSVEMAWDSTGDERECEVCDGNAAAGWIDAAETFPSGHSREPAHPLCRCATTTRIAAESRVAAAELDPANDPVAAGV